MIVISRRNDLSERRPLNITKPFIDQLMTTFTGSNSSDYVENEHSLINSTFSENIENWKFSFNDTNILERLVTAYWPKLSSNTSSKASEGQWALFFNSTISSESLLDVLWTSKVNSSAGTSELNFEEDGEQRYISLSGQVLITVLYVFGFTANLCSLVLLHRGTPARNRKLTLMMRCLTTNDLLALCTSTVLVSLRTYLSGAARASRWFCALRVLARFFGFSSGCVATVMAVERCIALTGPFFYQKHITVRVIQRAIFFQWLFVLGIVLLPFVGFGLYYRTASDGSAVCARYRQASSPTDIAYAYLMFGFGSLLCVVIVCCNLAVVGALCRLSPASGNIRRTTVSKDHLSFNLATREELSFAKLMVALCIFFVICWLPQMATIIVSQQFPDVRPDHPFYRIADVCTALHFVVDPIAYVLSRRPHRRGLRRLLKPIFQQCWTNTSAPPSSCTGSAHKEACAMAQRQASTASKS